MSVAVHDVRNPIAVLRASAQMAQRQIDRGDLEAARARLGIIIEQTDRVTLLMESLLDAAYVECGRLPLRLEQVDAAQLVESAAARIRLAGAGAEYGNRVLDLDVEPNAIGTWDRSRLGRAIEALLHNAYIYGPLDQAVVVRGRREGANLLLTFSGAGPGPSAEEIEHLFELFYRGTAAGEAGQPGSGLGLFIARGIARGHGGEVRFWPVGKPDAFVMELPLSDPA